MGPFWSSIVDVARRRGNMLVLLVTAGVLAAIAGLGSGGQTAIAPAANGAASTEREIVDQRTRTSRTFVGSRGEMVTRVWTAAVNYRSSSGEMRAIDNTLEATTEAGGGFANRANSYRALLPTDLSRPVRVDYRGAWASFRLLGSRSSRPEIAGSTARYPEALAGVDVVYAANGDELKEEMVLTDPSAARRFRFEVGTSLGVVPRLNDRGGVDFIGGDARTLFSFAPPVMYDAAGAGSDDLRFTLSPSAGGWTLELDAESSWIDSERRVWPVTVDPTTTFSPTADTYMGNGTLADSDFGSAENLSTGLNGDGRIRRSLLKFDVSSVPKEALVLNGRLALHTRGTGDTSTVAAHRVTRSWTTSATWNRYDGTNLWSTAGGEFDATVEDSTSVESATAQWEYWHPTKLVQSWVDGTQPNHGFLMKSTNEAAQASGHFHSAQSTSNQPYLEVNWHHRTGLHGSYTYDRHRLSDRMGLMVNVGNGNLVLQQRDLQVSGTGLDLAVERYYNSRSSWSHQGKGWTTNAGRDIFRSTYADGKTVVIHGPGMSPWRFYKDGSSYTTPPGVNAKLTDDGSGGHHLTFNRSREKWHFGSAHTGIASITDKNGHTITFSLAADSTTSSITDTQGRQVTFAYNTQKRMTSMTDQASDPDRVTSYGYTSSGGDTNKLLTSYTDAEGKMTSYAYDTGERLTEITDPRGNKTKIAYVSGTTKVASIIRVTDPVNGTGPTTTYSYDEPNRKTTITDPRGNSTTGDPNDGKTVYDYNRELRVTKVTNPLGHLADSTYTPNGDADTFTDTPGSTGNAGLTQLTYETSGSDPSNNLTGGTLPESESFSLSYWNSTTRTGDSFPGFERYLPRSFTNTQGQDTFYGYDPAGSVTDVKEKDDTSIQNKATLTYTTGTSPIGMPKGLLRTATDGEGRATTYSYDSAGNLTRVAPPTFATGNGTQLGDMVFTYDNVSRVSTVTDGKSQVATFCYDKLDRTKRIYWSNGDFTEYDYDFNGNQTARRSGTGATSCTNGTTSQTTSYVYDALNRRTQETFPGSITNTYNYDVNSQLQTLADTGGVLTYGYDAIDRLASVTFPKDPTNPTGPTQLIDVDYDDDLRKRTITYPKSTDTTSATGAKVVSKADRTGKTTLIEALSSTSASLRKLDYAYRPGNASSDKLLRSAEEVNDSTITTYLYDDLDRLCWATEVTPTSYSCSSPPSSSTTRSYTFDKASNRKTKVVGSTTTSYAYNEANQLCWSYTGSSTAACALPPLGAVDYDHDANGSMTKAGSIDYTYDIRDRLTAIEGSALSYLSPTNGELTAVAGTSYTNSLVGVTKRSGSPASFFLRSPDGEFLMERRSTGNYPVVADALGSTRWLLDGDTVVRSYTYDPDGNTTATSGSGPDTEVRFAGGHRMYAGGQELYHFGRRFYDAGIGRWTQADPLDHPTDLRQANRYGYASADPVNLSDPAGTFAGFVVRTVFQVGTRRVGVKLTFPASVPELGPLAASAGRVAARRGARGGGRPGTATAEKTIAEQIQRVPKAIDDLANGIF